MVLRRRFRGHEGLTPPTGLRARTAGPVRRDREDTPIDEEIVETEGAPVVEEIVEAEETIEVDEEIEGAEVENIVGEPIDLPDNSWKVPAIDDFADRHGIELPADAKKPAKLAIIQKWLDANVPTLTEGE